MPDDRHDLLPMAKECLIPEMALGSIVVVDNLSAHKVAGIRECLESAGMHLLYLPPYGPDFNPIEQVFSKYLTRN